jgi:Flp pilus assembly protein TadG
MRLTMLGLISGLFMMGALLTSCGGGGGGTAEAALAVTITPNNGSTQAASPGPFTCTVQVTSTMPPKGVTITVTAEVDGTSTAYYTSSVNNSQVTNTFNITNTPTLQTCVVNVSVVSNTKSTNTWTGSYRYSAK